MLRAKQRGSARSRRPRRSPVSFSRAVWIFPAALAAHIAEEAALDFPAWAARHASPRYSRRDFWTINAAGIAMTAGTTWAVSRWPRRPVVLAYFASQLSQQIPFNAVFHLGTTIAWRTYSPGLATALAQLPLWRCLARSARRERLLSRNGEIAAIAIGGPLHAAAVARQVFYAGRDGPGPAAR